MAKKYKDDDAFRFDPFSHIMVFDTTTGTNIKNIDTKIRPSIDDVYHTRYEHDTVTSLSLNSNGTRLVYSKYYTPRSFFGRADEQCEVTLVNLETNKIAILNGTGSDYVFHTGFINNDSQLYMVLKKETSEGYGRFSYARKFYLGPQDKEVFIYLIDRNSGTIMKKRILTEKSDKSPIKQCTFSSNGTFFAVETQSVAGSQERIFVWKKPFED